MVCTQADLACGIYAITTAVAIQLFERSRYGRTRKKQKFYARVRHEIHNIFSVAKYVH